MNRPRDAPAEEAQRLDKWLWAARFFKTRALAAEAVNGGKVQVDGQRAKPARAIRPGCEVRVRKDGFEITAVVRGVSKQRGPASAAVLLYEETPESRQRREAASDQRRLERAAQPRPVHGGRPTKRDRRQMQKIRPES